MIESITTIRKAIFILSLSFAPMISSAQTNTNEDLVPFYHLPDPLAISDTSQIETPRVWAKERRTEILAQFENEMYGSFPDKGIFIRHEIESIDKEALDGKATKKEIKFIFTNGQQQIEAYLLLYLPNESLHPSPVFVGLNFWGNHSISADPSISLSTSWMRKSDNHFIENNKATELSRGKMARRWPIREIIHRGYGLATMYYGDLDPDFDDDFQNGLHQLLDRGDRQNVSAISAWAFGLSKVMDYLESEKRINFQNIIVLGHSRLGKAALWAGALDQRFSMVISNNSGCGGAALSRRRFGEKLVDINNRFPHWFSPNFRKYNDNEDELPVDQHMLLALIAPRSIYVSSASEDSWADPKGELLSLVHAGPVYTLFGHNVLQSESLPSSDISRIMGRMGYHLRMGRHDLTILDWQRFMDFADVQLVLE